VFLWQHPFRHCLGGGYPSFQILVKCISFHHVKCYKSSAIAEKLGSQYRYLARGTSVWGRVKVTRGSLAYAVYQCTRFGTRALRRLKAAINTEMKLKAIQQYIYIGLLHILLCVQSDICGIDNILCS